MNHDALMELAKTTGNVYYMHAIYNCHHDPPSIVYNLDLIA